MGASGLWLPRRGSRRHWHRLLLGMPLGWAIARYCLLPSPLFPSFVVLTLLMPSFMGCCRPGCLWDPQRLERHARGLAHHYLLGVPLVAAAGCCLVCDPCACPCAGASIPFERGVLDTRSPLVPTEGVLDARSPLVPTRDARSQIKGYTIQHVTEHHDSAVEPVNVRPPLV